MRYLTATSILACVLFVGVVHCGGDDSSASARPDVPGAGPGLGATSTTGGGTGTGSGTGGSGGGLPPPPEMEVEKAFQAPVATERFVWAANPKTGRVALIDSQSYQVKTV